MVSDSGGTISRRPIRDAPIPVIAEWSSNFSVVIIGRTCLAKSCGAMSSGGMRRRFFSAVGRNSGSHTSCACLEDHLDGLAELEVVEVAVNDVGGQPDPGILLDGDLRDDVRRRADRAWRTGG